MTDFWFYIVIAIIILHFVVGFAYLIFKLSPKKEDKQIDDSSSNSKQQLNPSYLVLLVKKNYFLREDSLGHTNKNKPFLFLFCKYS